MIESKLVMVDSNRGKGTKTTKGGWHAAIFIICVEAANRFAYTGLASNLIQYLTKELHEPMDVAVKNVNIWNGVTSLFPLIGGFVADSYLGRFNTVIISSVIYLLGMIFLTLTTSVLKNKKKLFFITLYVLSIGDGGHKPCVQTFAADQFDEDTAEERDAKSSFFNLWYLAIVFGSVSAVFIVVYLQDNKGWAVGLGVLAGVLGVAFVVFLLGVKRYRKESPKGSPFTSVAQVFVAASRKWRVKLTPGQENYWYGNTNRDQLLHTLAHTDQYRFLNKATIIDEVDSISETKDPWRLCTVTQVEEVKLILRLIPIGLCCLMFTAVQSQISTFFTKQGSTMDRSIGPHFQIPPASLQGLVGIVIFIAVAFYDRAFVPIARKITGYPSGITVLQRIGIGLALSIVNMVVAALIETKRVSVARENNLVFNPNSVLPMSIWWLLPQYAILGTSDAFTIVGLQELFYEQMPETMRSMGAAAFLSIIGFGSLVCNVIISVSEGITAKMGDKWFADNINKAHINDFYWVLAGLSAVNLCVYVPIAKRFVYKKKVVAEKSMVE